MIPDSVTALLRPLAPFSVRRKCRNAGLWVENTENAPSAASAMAYTVSLPVRTCGKRSATVRKCSTRRLKVSGRRFCSKGKLVGVGNSHGFSRGVLQPISGNAQAFTWKRLSSALRIADSSDSSQKV